MDDLITDFIAETNESLEELDLDLVNLEKNPNDQDLISKIFRLKHTIKGTCGFLGLPRLEKVAHHAENVLGRFRDKELEVTPEYVTLIFESIDRIKFIVAAIEETGAEPDGDDSELIAKLDAVYEGKAVPNDTGSEATKEGSDETQESDSEDTIEQDAADTDDAEKAEDETQSNIQNIETANDLNDENHKQAPPPPAPKVESQTAETVKTPPATIQTLRVNVDILEDLMTMVSELVLTRNQLLQILRTGNESKFATPLQRLNHVVSDLQEGVMKTRMQPIGNAWAKLPRIIRDLSMELGKKIELVMHGQDTELDRQVLELIKDPLTHMVRNSGDHGIESPEDRKAAGKPETGKITLDAFHEGGHIIIRISDDGKGLSSEKIKAKILEKKLATAEELEQMSTQQIHQYIFNAGLSTAEKVTSVSGRGVGMDVVRTNIEKIGGSIDLTSKEGFGSTFTIKIPLTLAIVSALIVESSGERFAIPQLAVRELVMASHSGENKIEMLKDTPVFRLRQKLLPLVSLSELLKINPVPSLTVNEEGDIVKSKETNEKKSENNVIHHEDENEAHPIHESKQDTKQAVSQNRYIVVVQVGTYDFGIIVDRVYDTEEIVVKPVSSLLRNIEIFSGNTILGDGSVIMIIDPNGIANACGKVQMDDAAALEQSLHKNEYDKEKLSLLLFTAGDKTPKAVPLSLIARLENIETSKIEHSSGKMMVQYRERLMELLPFNASVSIEGKNEKPVLVFQDRDRLMGLLVDEIVDIKEEVVDIQMDSGQTGLMGSAIIDGKATDVVDVMHYLDRANEKWFKNHDDTPYDPDGENGENNDHQNGNGKQRILLVDDSSFFRNMLTPILNVAGYDVTPLESPIKALEMCDKGVEFDLIVSDIEMPDMNGFEFAQRVKSEGNWKNTPMVALSSHVTDEDKERGKKVGFNRYVAKFDRSTLLSTLTKALTTAEKTANQNG